MIEHAQINSIFSEQVIGLITREIILMLAAKLPWNGRTSPPIVKRVLLFFDLRHIVLIVRQALQDIENTVFLLDLVLIDCFIADSSVSRVI